MRILGVSGSLQANSANTELLRVAAASAPAGATIEVFTGLRELPHYDPDLEPDGSPPPQPVARWRAAIAAADALLIASPEYGHSLPGSLKNGIDWVIPSGELEGKTVAITAAVPHPTRGRLGLAALRTTLGAVSAQIVGGEPIARGPTFAAAVAALLAELVRTVAATRAGPPDPDAQ